MKQSIYRRFRENALALFFIRLGMILVGMTLLGFGGIYWYFESQSARQLDTLIETRLPEFGARTRKIDLQDPEAFRQLSERVEALIKTGALLQIELSGRGAARLYGAESAVLPQHVAQLFEHFDLEPDQTRRSMMIPLETGQFVMIYAKRLPLNRTPDLRIKIAVPLPSETVTAMRNRTREVFAWTAVILLLVVLATFPLIYRQYRELRRGKMALLRSNLDMIRVLGSAAALRDSDTNLHNYRVTYYTIRLAEALELESAAFPGLIKGAFLHDIGKIGIPDAILRKEGSLDAGERREMERHVELGRGMLAPVAWIGDAVAVVACHHERYDGGGYPNGTRGEAILLEARIFAVADVFDALTSRRPYKAPFSLEASLAHIREASGGHFDPAVATAFLAIAERLYEQTRDRDEPELEALLTDAVTPYVREMIEAIDG